MQWLQILTGDCRAILPTIEPESMQCCVTSPPYWGLRDYGTASWEGGSAECEHKQFLGGNGSASAKQITSNGTQEYYYRDICAKCGARRIDSQLGLESTPEEYLAKMVGVFREVWRVLRDDGTLWVNMGDAYASSSYGGRNDGDIHHRTQSITDAIYPIDKPKNDRPFPPGLKPKDLCGIPWRLAFALQADGWYLRSDIIWHKPNPMPESVTDRPTKSHEYIFLLTKQEKYFYDAEAIREKSSYELGTERCAFTSPRALAMGREPSGNEINGWVRESGFRNKRTVWTIATQPYAEAHFATFPEDLVKPCVMAGSKSGDIVLDPFAGSGTVGKVALELGRKAILIELNSDYVELAKDRTFVTPGFL